MQDIITALYKKCVKKPILYHSHTEGMNHATIQSVCVCVCACAWVKHDGSIQTERCHHCHMASDSGMCEWERREREIKEREGGGVIMISYCLTMTRGHTCVDMSSCGHVRKRLQIPCSSNVCHTNRMDLTALHTTYNNTTNNT